MSHLGLLDHVLGALDGLEPGRLRLKIPGSASLVDLEMAAPALTALRAAGVKIDCSVIRSMLCNNDRAVVKLLIDLAHNIGVKVTAEGIETAEQLAVLRKLGCTGGQGYSLGRPVPVTPDTRPACLVSPVGSA